MNSALESIVRQELAFTTPEAGEVLGMSHLRTHVDMIDALIARHEDVLAAPNQDCITRLRAIARSTTANVLAKKLIECFEMHFEAYEVGDTPEYWDEALLTF